MTGVTGLLVSPISWAHHWVWVIPALAVLIRDNDRTIAICGYVLFALAPMWWTPYIPEPLRVGWHLLLLPVANCYLLAGLFFLGLMAVRLRQGVSTITKDASIRRSQPPRGRRSMRLARTGGRRAAWNARPDGCPRGRGPSGRAVLEGRPRVPAVVVASGQFLQQASQRRRVRGLDQAVMARLVACEGPPTSRVLAKPDAAAGVPAGQVGRDPLGVQVGHRPGGHRSSFAAR